MHFFLRSISAILIFFLLAGEVALGSRLCSQVRDLLPRQFKLNLEKRGFKIDKDRLYDLNRRNGHQEPILIGTLEILEQKYLFRRKKSPEDFKEILAGPAGLDKAILESQTQTTGKGVYISRHPFDTEKVYGSVLAIFKTHRPLIYLKWDADSKTSKDYFYEEGGLERLRDAGIDLVQNSNPSWFSLIQADGIEWVSLENPDSVSAATEIEWLAQAFYFSGKKKFQNRKYYKNASRDSVLVKVLNKEPLPPQQLSELFVDLFNSDGIGEFLMSFDLKNQDYLRTELIIPFLALRPEPQSDLAMAQNVVKIYAKKFGLSLK